MTTPAVGNPGKITKVTDQGPPTENAAEPRPPSNEKLKALGYSLDYRVTPSAVSGAALRVSLGARI